MGRGMPHPLLLLLLMPRHVWLPLALCSCTDLPKIVAPKMRHVVEKEDPLEDYIVKDDTPMEDKDPTLNLNPCAAVNGCKQRTTRIGCMLG